MKIFKIHDVIKSVAKISKYILIDIFEVVDIGHRIEYYTRNCLIGILCSMYMWQPLSRLFSKIVKLRKTAILIIRILFKMRYSERGFPKMSEIYSTDFNLEASPSLLALIRKTKGAWGYWPHSLWFLFKDLSPGHFWTFNFKWFLSYSKKKCIC